MAEKLRLWTTVNVSDCDLADFLNRLPEPKEVPVVYTDKKNQRFVTIRTTLSECALEKIVERVKADEEEERKVFKTIHTR